MSTRQYKIGYEVRREIMDGQLCSIDDYVEYNAYDIKTGLYIGTPKLAQLLYTKLRIKPCAISDRSIIASIGYRRFTKMWFGWNSRYIRGFTIGQVIPEGDMMTDVIPIETRIKNRDQSKMLAIEFVKLIS